MSLALIVGIVRALAAVAPTVIRQGHGERVEHVLNTVATLGERGEEAVAELQALKQKLEQMESVDRLEQERIWNQIAATHDAIQEAAKAIPAKEPPPAPNPMTGPTGGPAADSGVQEEGAAPPAGDSGGSGDSKV